MSECTTLVELDVVYENGWGNTVWKLERYVDETFRDIAHWKCLKIFVDETDAITFARNKHKTYPNVLYRVVRCIEKDEGTE